MLSIKVMKEEFERIVQKTFKEYCYQYDENLKYAFQNELLEMKMPEKEWESLKKVRYWQGMENLDRLLREGKDMFIKEVEFYCTYIENGTEIRKSCKEYCQLYLEKGNVVKGTDPRKEYYVLHLLYL